MATKSGAKNLIRLKCEKCKSPNYYYLKNKSAEYKLNLKKFCKNCRAHTVHKESRK